ncbi:MAG: hypothetical protein LIR46_12755 [Bacteroidota bacterium]|nr:hypothetical protein [Bacteroidota bacterium]
MSNFLKYNISVVYLDSYDRDKRHHIYERVIYTANDINEATDKFLDYIYKQNHDLKPDFDLYKNDIDDMKNEFGLINEDVWYRVSLKEIKDFSNNKLYVGPGAYLIKGSLLQ